MGCPAPDAFNVPISEALPLADQPHLLQPNARREDMFGMPKQPITVPSTNDSSSSSLEIPPIRLGLSSQNKNDVIQNTTSNTNTVVIVTPATVDLQDDDKTIVSIVPEDVSQKRALSPKPGTSKPAQQPSQHLFFKKNRFFITSKSFVNEFDEDEEDDSGGEEPQDLSQQTLNSSSNKMDIDEPKPTKSSNSEVNIFDSDNDDDSSMRSPAHKKNRMETDEETKTIIRSGKLGPDTSITPEVCSEVTIDPEIQQNSDSQPSTSTSILTIQQTDPSVSRPPIIVTRRNVADAIESVTANVLAKNKKTTLSECGTSETPLNFLPNNFVYDKAGGGSGEGYERDQQSGSPGKSVIVRVGPSVSGILCFL